MTGHRLRRRPNSNLALGLRRLGDCFQTRLGDTGGRSCHTEYVDCDRSGGMLSQQLIQCWVEAEPDGGPVSTQNLVNLLCLPIMILGHRVGALINIFFLYWPNLGIASKKML